MIERDLKKRKKINFVCTVYLDDVLGIRKSKTLCGQYVLTIQYLSEFHWKKHDPVFAVHEYFFSEKARDNAYNKISKKVGRDLNLIWEKVSEKSKRAKVIDGWALVYDNYRSFYIYDPLFEWKKEDKIFTDKKIIVLEKYKMNFWPSHNNLHTLNK